MASQPAAGAVLEKVPGQLSVQLPAGPGPGQGAIRVLDSAGSQMIQASYVR